MDRINGANTVDIGDGRRGFRGQNASAGLSGTELAPDWFNALQEEVMAVVEGAGLSPDGGDWTQLRAAITHMIGASLPALGAYLLKSGGTMTGALVLAGGPTAGLHAATKAYVDELVAAAGVDLSGYLQRAGGTMTGTLTLAAAPVADLQAATKKYVDDLVVGAGGITPGGIGTVVPVGDLGGAAHAVGYTTTMTVADVPGTYRLYHKILVESFAAVQSGTNDTLDLYMRIA